MPGQADVLCHACLEAQLRAGTQAGIAGGSARLPSSYCWYLHSPSAGWLDMS